MGLQNLRAAQPILPHAGQNHGDDRAAIDLPDRSEQRIDRRTAGVLRRRLIQTDADLPPLDGHLQVKVSGRDQDLARLDRVALARFLRPAADRWSEDARRASG